MVDKIENSIGKEQHKLCFDCNETFGVIINTNEGTYLCFRCFRNKFGEKELAEILETADQTSALKGWRPIDKGVSYNITKDIVERAFEIFERETKIKDVFEQPNYDMPRTVHFESATFLLSLEEAPLQEIDELKSKFADDAGLSDKLNKICNDRNRYILTGIYGDCPRCNLRSLIKKQKSKVLDTEICHVCSSQELIDDLVKRPLMSLEDYEIFFADHQAQIPSNNKDFVNTLVWNEFSLGTERDLVENYVRQKLHVIERHPVDQRGWCRYCEMFHTASIIPTKVRDVLEACPECVKICSKENLINENIAHTIKKHIKQDHKDIYKFIMQSDSTFYQWAFITPEEDERRRAENWRQSMGDNKMNDYHRERNAYVKRHYTFSRKEITEEDPNQVLPSMQNYPINIDGDTSELDKGHEYTYRVASPEIAEEVNKALAVFKTPIIKSKLNRYDESNAVSIIRNHIREYMTILMADYESVVENKFNRKEFDKFIKNTLKEIAKNDTGTVKFEAYLNKLRKQTKEWKKISKRNELIQKITIEIKNMVLNNLDDPSIRLKGRGIEVDPKIITGIIKKYSLSDVEEARVHELSTGLIQKFLGEAVKAEVQRNPPQQKIMEDIIAKEMVTEFSNFLNKNIADLDSKHREAEITNILDATVERVFSHHLSLTRKQKSKICKLTEEAINEAIYNQLKREDTDETTQKDEKEQLISDEIIKEHSKILIRYNEEDIEPEQKPQPKLPKLNYEEFKNFLTEKGILNRIDFENYQRAEVNETIPKRPESFYKKDGWSGWRDATGYIPKKPALTQEQINGILNELKDNWDLFVTLEEGAFIWLFDQWGVFGIKDPLTRAIFTEFAHWKDIPKKQNAIWEYLNIRDSKIIEEQIIKNHDKKVETRDEFLDRQFSTSVTEVPLFDSNIESVMEIIQKSDHYTPTMKNDKIDKFMELKFKKNIWTSFFDNPKQDLDSLPYNGLEFHDKVIDDFKRQYNSVTDDYKHHWEQYVKFYRFRGKPSLMQRYGAFMLFTLQGLLNMFGTGTGKTLTAILGSKVINAKHVFWICPKNVIDQTKEMIVEAFPDVSEVTTVLDNPRDKSIPLEFFQDPSKNGNIIKKNGKYMTKYHLINYEQFSLQRNSERLLNQLLGKKIELFVLDESQMVKNRNESEEKASHRRKSVISLLNDLRLHNPHMRVLMLSATPVVNNVGEFMSLYKMISGTDLVQHGMANYTSVKNGARMFVEIQPFSIRYEAKYDIEVFQPITECIGFLPDEMSDDTVREWKENYLELESFMTGIRIPYMLKKMREIREKNPDEKFVIYTHYVGNGIVDQLQTAFLNAGYRVGLFTGDDKSGWIEERGFNAEGERIYDQKFKEGKLDVLIASRTFQVGVDGAQRVCRNIFFNGFVWTDTEFEQTKGRLVRGGQEAREVYVNMFFATINGFKYDHDVKFLRVLQKRALGSLCRDGRLPKDVSLGEGKEKENAIEKILENRRSGFPTKEELNRIHAEEAQKEVKTQLEELKKQYPNANFDLDEIGDDKDG